MTEREIFIALVSNEKLKKADAIVLLEGDGYFRVSWAVELYKRKWAPKIVASTGIDDKGYGSFPNLEKKLKEYKVPNKDIIVDAKSRHTREQAINIIEMATRKKWKKIILVASHYHQYRAGLTFLKVMQEKEIKIQIINSPVRDLNWFSKNSWGTRFNLLKAEFERIEKYRKLGHLATYKDAIAYQAWKEKQK